VGQFTIQNYLRGKSKGARKMKEIKAMAGEKEAVTSKYTQNKHQTKTTLLATTSNSSKQSVSKFPLNSALPAKDTCTIDSDWDLSSFASMKQPRSTSIGC